MKQPLISIVVIVYNMSREAPRTLYSLSSEYQIEVNSEDYEVIVVDNGSNEFVDYTKLEAEYENLKYYKIENAPPSPAHAINYGVSKSQGKYIGIMIDGARLASPGIINKAISCINAFRNPVIQTIGMHLGLEKQSISILNGYNQSIEDDLLNSINWKANGYKLFQISSLAGSCKHGYFVPISECSLLFLAKKMFNYVGGYNELFDIPGGGFTNLDFMNRTMAIPDIEPLMLLGEATFHQIHGGTVTNTTSLAQRQKIMKIYTNQYEQICGKSFKRNSRSANVFGSVTRESIELIRTSTELY